MGVPAGNPDSMSRLDRRAVGSWPVLPAEPHEAKGTVGHLESTWATRDEPEGSGGIGSEAVGEPTYQSVFWASYLSIGFFTQLLAILVIVGYLETTHYRVHRSILLGVAGTVVVSSVIGLLTSARIACSRWRSQISTMWCLASIATVGVCAYSDGGINSPLLYLLALPVLYATAALQLPQVRACVVTAVFQPVWLAIINPKVTGPYGALLVLGGVVVGVSVLAISLAGYRSRFQEQQRMMAEELEVRSLTDSLTGCLTSQVFHLGLTDEYKRAIRDHRQLSLLICDVDLLKEYNDAYGHLAGDALLARLSASIRHAVRAGDYVGRVGGDEFGVILPDTNERDAYLTAARIMTRVGRNGSVTSLSIGIAALDASVTCPEDLFCRAERALQEAKSSGRGTLRVSPQ